jgi:hypothetical protein
MLYARLDFLLSARIYTHEYINMTSRPVPTVEAL